MEEWMDIVGYEGYYQISTHGRILSLKVGHKKRKVPRLMKPQVEKKGYLRIMLRKLYKYEHFMIHRLVATAFIPNPHNLPFVNHKDENKKNNMVSNLEWCTNEYNENYGTRNLRSSLSRMKPILVFDKSTNQLLAEFPSIKDAAKAYGKDEAYIAKYCRGLSSIRRKDLKGLRFEFKYKKDNQFRSGKLSNKLKL